MQTATAQAYIARWSALLTHAAQAVFAKSLLFEDLRLHTAGDGELLDFALDMRANLETGQYKHSLPTTKLLGDQMDMAEQGVREKKIRLWA